MSTPTLTIRRYDDLTTEQRESLTIYGLERPQDCRYILNESGDVFAYEAPKMFQAGEPVSWLPAVDIETNEVIKDMASLGEYDSPPTLPAAVAAPTAPAASGPVVLLKYGLIVRGSLNPRRRFQAEKMSELRGSMMAHGFKVAHPLEVRPHPTLAGKYELIAGERRHRTAGALILEGAIAEEVPCVVKEMTDAAALEAIMVENDIRDDFTPIERARGYSAMLQLRDEQGHPLYTIESLASRLGRSVRQVAYARSLAVLDGTECATYLEEGRISVSHARQLARVPCRDTQSVLLKWLFSRPEFPDEAAPVRALEVKIDAEMRPLQAVGFDLTDALLVPVEIGDHGDRMMGGACTDCPHNSANLPDDARGTVGEAGQKKKAMCINVTCLRAKQAAAHQAWRKTIRSSVATLPVEENARLWNSSGVALAAGCGMVDLAEKPGELDLRQGVENDRTWKQLTKAQGVPMTAALDGRGKERQLVAREAAVAAAIENGHDIFKGHVKAAAGHAAPPAAVTTPSASSPASAAPVGSAPLEPVDHAPSPVAAAMRRDEQREAQAREQQREIEQKRRLREAELVAMRDAAAALKRPGREYLALTIRALAEMAANAGNLLPTARLFGYRGENSDGAQRHLLDACTDKDGALPDNQLIALQLMLAHAIVFDDSRASWEKAAFAVLGVDLKAVAKTAKASIEAEWEAADAKDEIASGLVWTSERTQHEEFTWEGNRCVNPDTCHLAMPAGCKAILHAHVAVDAKGEWHAGGHIALSKAANAQHGYPTESNSVSYTTRALALKAAILGLKSVIGEVCLNAKQRDMITERLGAFVEHIEGMGKAKGKRAK